MTDGIIQKVILYWHHRHYHISDEYIKELEQELIEEIKKYECDLCKDKSNTYRNHMIRIGELIGDTE